MGQNFSSIFFTNPVLPWASKFFKAEFKAHYLSSLHPAIGLSLNMSNIVSSISSSKLISVLFESVVKHVFE